MSGTGASADIPSKRIPIFIAGSGCDRAVTPLEGETVTLGRGEQARLDELVVADAGRARGLGQTGILLGVGQNPRERIDLDDVGHARRVDADVDAGPVAAAGHVVRVEGDA